jgi:DNA-binding transcriptional MerR regulator
MRIGELADLAGVSTRTVRHYHHRGLLPEPERRPNGYREYGLRDAIVLARIRRLTELGLSLDEVQDVLADDQGRDLREILRELDRDLAAQEEQIRDRRALLALLIECSGDPHDADDAVSPDIAELLRHLPPAAQGMASKERELLALLDSTVAPDDRAELITRLQRRAQNPEAVAHGQEIHRRLDELADASVDDPRIGPLAAELARVAAALGLEKSSLDDPFSTAVLDSLAPAQAEVIRRAQGET